MAHSCWLHGWGETGITSCNPRSDVAREGLEHDLTARGVMNAWRRRFPTEKVADGVRKREK
jgi:hypothetical protein